MEPMSEEMKKELQLRKQNEEIHNRIHAQRRTRYPERKKDTYVLPEDWKAKDWKNALRIIKGRKLKKKGTKK